MRTGVILAGGRSTRFGDQDKAVAELAGTPMIRRVAERIAPVVDELIVNCRAQQREAIDSALDSLSPTPTFAVDDTPDRGPVAGIRNGLRAATGEYAVVVACDMPFVDPALVSHLFDRASGHDAAVPRVDDQWFQTTQAVYHTAAMADACERALEDDNPRVLDPLFEIDYVTVDEPEIREYAALESFENLNTHEEFVAAADRLQS